jgi:hypothetical protein
MNLVSASKTWKYKGSVIGALVLGFILFLVGVIIAGNGANNIFPTAITIEAPNIQDSPSGNGDQTIDLYTLETLITVHTDPGNYTDMPVMLNIRSGFGDDSAEITKSISSGGSAVLRLKKRGGFYAVGSKIIIDISCGSASTRTLIATICVPETAIEFDFTNALRQTSGSPTDSISARNFSSPNVVYSFRPVLKVWGETIVSGQATQVSWSSDCIDQDLNTYENGDINRRIDPFFGKNKGLAGNGSFAQNNIVLGYGYVYPGATHTFNITATLTSIGGGQQFFTGRYTLRITE